MTTTRIFLALAFLCAVPALAHADSGNGGNSSPPIINIDISGIINAITSLPSQIINAFFSYVVSGLIDATHQLVDFAFRFMFSSPDPMWFCNSYNGIMAIVETLYSLALMGLALIDEFEVLGVNRNAEGINSRTLANMLLTELDNFKPESGAYVMCSTNSPWLLDSAIIRSGRLDNMVYVGVPDTKTRKELLMHYSKGMALGSIDFGRIAEMTEFYSCSDMQALCIAAASGPFRRALNSGKPQEIRQDDFEMAAKKRMSSTALEWFESASATAFPESFKIRFEPMIQELERYRQWRNASDGGSQFR